MNMKEIKKYLAQIGAKGGKVKSNRKRIASISNGKKGGRPRKKVHEESQKK